MSQNDDSSSDPSNHRRTVLKAVGTGVAAALAGCSGGSGGGGETTEGSGGGGETADGSDGGTSSGSGDSSGGGSGDTFRLGVYGPLSGPVSNIGEAKRNGWEMVTRLENENGGIDGTEIDLPLADSQSQAANGRSAVNRIIAQENIESCGGASTRP